MEALETNAEGASPASGTPVGRADHDAPTGSAGTQRSGAVAAG